MRNSSPYYLKIKTSLTYRIERTALKRAFQKTLTILLLKRPVLGIFFSREAKLDF